MIAKESKVYKDHLRFPSDPTLFRRDQVWFTAKDAGGETDLYSLEDFSPRKGETLHKGYLVARYGAVPVLERFEFSQSPENLPAQSRVLDQPE